MGAWEQLRGGSSYGLLALLSTAGCGDAVAARDAGPGDAGRDAGADAGVPDAGARDTGPDPAEAWRSALYPEDWEPGHRDGEGRFLHDFSYAGYRNGETPLAMDLPEEVHDVVELGADPTGVEDSTAPIQAAIELAEAGGGGIVRFPEGLYRVDGLLRIGASRVVLRGDGPSRSRLFFTASEGLGSRSHVTFAGAAETDLSLPLTSDVSTGDTAVEVAEPGDLAAGDDITIGWVITDRFVEAHGMTGTWRAFNGTWQAFFRRTVRSVETVEGGARVHFAVPLRYDGLRVDGLELRRERGLLSECGVESLGLANVVGPDEAWAEDQLHLLELTHVADCFVRDVATFVSPRAPAAGEGAGAHVASGGLLIRAAKRVTVRDVEIGEAIHRGPGGNGYLFEVRASSEVLFESCAAWGGRHNFIQNWGFGTSGCVWLRVDSRDGVALPERGATLHTIGASEFHHSLAMANLIDDSVLGDGWRAHNRLTFSSGAGHSATQNVFWNVRGSGAVHSMQYGWGYVIGSGPELRVVTAGIPWQEEGAAPEDFVEGIGRAAGLRPASLYEAQLARRLGR